MASWWNVISPLNSRCTIDKDWRCREIQSINAGKYYWSGRLSTVDLLIQTSLDQLLFILKILFTFFTKQSTLMRRSTVLSLPPQVKFPGKWRHWHYFNYIFCINYDQSYLPPSSLMPRRDKLERLPFARILCLL